MTLPLLWMPGPTELLLILGVLVLLFGAKKIPEIARGLGSGVNEFKAGLRGEDGGEKPKELPPSDSSDSA